ncbi:MAG: ABC transporter ATP-binding protein [Ignavibacteriae bacterium]|nr:MAG: ABC transporter ATP-binding protein [Ignavibacteriota bacterium]
MKKNPILELENIHVEYFDESDKRYFTILDKFNLSVNSGEFVAIIGDSGAGKTTLLDFIAGFIKTTNESKNNFIYKIILKLEMSYKATGTVKISGDDVSSVEPMDRNVGLVMQNFSLYDHYNVKDNLAFPLKMKGINKKEILRDVNSVAEKLGILRLLNNKISEISGGERQRVAIGKLLLKKPKIALFDEAFSNLDFKLRQVLRKNVIENYLSNENALDTGERAVLYVTHDLMDFFIADKIVIFKKNKVTRKSDYEILYSDKDKKAWQKLEHSGLYKIQLNEFEQLFNNYKP